MFYLCFTNVLFYGNFGQPIQKRINMQPIMVKNLKIDFDFSLIQNTLINIARALKCDIDHKTICFNADTSQ